MAEIRVIITGDGQDVMPGGNIVGSPVAEVDTTFVIRNKADAHEYFERALTMAEIEPGGLE